MPSDIRFREDLIALKSEGGGKGKVLKGKLTKKQKAKEKEKKKAEKEKQKAKDEKKEEKKTGETAG